MIQANSPPPLSATKMTFVVNTGHLYTNSIPHSAFCCLQLHDLSSLVHRLPPFLFSVCVHNSMETSENQGRPGSIHHVSVRGEEGPIFKYVHTKLESDFLLIKISSFEHAKV